VSEESSEISADFPTPLRSLLTELHEVYEELMSVGFPERVAIDIVSRIVLDSMMYRGSDTGDEEEDDDDVEDEGDENDRGIK
jgi:hypothetical protein